MASKFWGRHPEYVTTTAAFDQLRSQQYSQLDEQGHVYLDYAGSGLPAQAQLDAHDERSRCHIAGNPHSISPASDLSNQKLAETRQCVLDFLNASPGEYAVIFTANATGAARLLGEAYPFDRRSRLILTADNHNSINGLRCFANKARCRTVYIPVGSQELRTDTAVVEKTLATSGHCWMRKRSARGLFAYPAQSNFTGVQHPLSWVKTAQDNGYDVLLDAAAYLPSARLDMSEVQPEFVMMSWYKVFGYPTGVGCLVGKHSSLAKLQRPWFSGGTVNGVMVKKIWHAMADGEARFEDGTVNFLAVPDVLFGLKWLSRLNLQALTTRLQSLTRWLIETLRTMTHDNGVRLAKIHGPLSTQSRGATVAFNLFDNAGTQIDERRVGADAALAKISIRVGCFCNPGANEAAQGVDRQTLLTLTRAGRERFEQVHDELGRPLAGAVRVSLGIASNFADVEAFLEFVERTYKNLDVALAKN